MAFAAGQKLTAAALNAAVGATWTTFTPAWTAQTSNPSIGNGVLIGGWCKVGKSITMRLTLKWGSTTTGGSGGWLFGLPETAATVTGSGSDPVWTGVVYGFDLSVANRVGSVAIRSGGTTAAITSEGTGDTWRVGVPQAWNTSDLLAFEITYEAATF